MSRTINITVRPKRELTIGVSQRGPAGAVLPPGAEGQVLGYGPGGVPVAVNPQAGGAYDDTAIKQRVATLEGAPPAHTHGWAAITDKPAAFPAAPHTHAWAEVSGKPATFAPAPHRHDASEIDNLPVASTAWADLTGVPAAFPPLAHGHVLADITGLQGALDGKAAAVHVHSWTQITDKPATFAPSPHAHAIADVTGLQPALDGKAPTGHAHAWADITGKPAAFPPAAHGHALADVTGLQAALDAAPGLLAVPVRTTMPSRPATGQVALYPRRRAGYDFVEVLRASGRDLSLQPHLGRGRVGAWTPNGSPAIGNIGLNPSSVGTLSAPAMSAASLASSSVRFRITSAATAVQAAEYRGSQTNLWRGNAPGLGGFLAIFRISPVTLVAGCNGFFGLASTGNLVNPLDVTTWGGQLVGLGFKEGVHANWQIVCGPGTGANVLTDLGPDFPINDLTAMLTLYLYSAPNGSSIMARVVNEANGKAVDLDLTAGIPAPTMFLAPRVHMDNGPTAAAVAFDCYGVYVESDF